MSDRDYYEILGLTPSADGAMVDQAYWHLVRKYQTLAATNSRAQYMIDELNEAYGVLGNPRLREQYDAFRDDVLIRRGMVRPVPSKPKEREQKPAQPRERREKVKRDWSMPVPQHWRTYGISAIIALLAFAAAWQGVNIVLVVIALAAGLGFSLMPTVTKRISEISFEMPQMPQMPQVTIPDVKPRIDLPKLGELQVPVLKDPIKDEGIDADTLSQSTRETIRRWRNSVGLKAPMPGQQIAAPSDTLMEIVETEKQIEEQDGEAFNAVMDILRSGAKAAPHQPQS